MRPLVPPGAEQPVQAASGEAQDERAQMPRPPMPEPPEYSGRRLPWRLCPEMMELAVWRLIELWAVRNRRPTAPQIFAMDEALWRRFGLDGRDKADGIRRQLCQLMRKPPRGLPRRLEGISPILKHAFTRHQVNPAVDDLLPRDLRWWPQDHAFLREVLDYVAAGQRWNDSPKHVVAFPQLPHAMLTADHGNRRLAVLCAAGAARRQ